MPAAIKVLMLSGWYFPASVGGTESYVHWLAKDLATLGVDVAVAHPSAPEDMETGSWDGVRVFRYQPASGAAEEPSGPLARVLDAFHPDIVHVHTYTPDCGLKQVELVAARRIPVVVTVHTPSWNCARGSMMLWGSEVCDGRMTAGRCAACYLNRQGLPKAAAAALSFLSFAAGPASSSLPGRARTALAIRRLIGERTDRALRFLELSRRVVVVCGWLRDALLVNGVDPSKLELCRHGLPAEAGVSASPPAEPGTLRIGYLGRLDPVKGVDVLVRAFLRLRGPAKLLIYGGAQGPEGALYEARVRGIAGNDPRIEFHGFIEAAKVSACLRSLDALAVPSIWLETGPLVVLQAFAAGCPVIGSASGGIEELVKHEQDGLLVRTGDVRSWQRALERIQNDRPLLARLRAGIAPVRTSADVALSMNGLYERVLAEDPR